MGKCKIIGGKVVEIVNPLFTTNQQGSIIMGSPTGSDAFRRSKCEEITNDAADSMSMLRTLQVPAKIALDILKFCINTRVGYLARVQEPIIAEASLKAFDRRIDETVASIARHGLSAVTSGYVAIIRSLPIEYGGLGIHRYSWVPGQIGCTKSRELVRSFVSTYIQSFLNTLNNWIPVEIGTRNSPIMLDDLLVEDHLARLHNDDEVAQGQNRLSEVAEGCYSSAYHSFLSQLQTNGEKARAAWLLSSKFAGSGCWLSGVIGSGTPIGFNMSNDEFILALRSRLLLSPTQDMHSPPTRCVCNKAITHEPYHFVDCDGSRHRIVRRHDDCVGVLHQTLRKNLPNSVVSLSPQLERADAPGQFITGDMALQINGRTIIIDVVVTDPAAQTYRDAPISSSENADVANTTREGFKRTHYANTQPNVVAAGNFVPFAIEATGRLGPAANAFLQQLFPPSITGNSLILRTLSNKLNATIIKENAAAMLFLTNRAKA